MGTFKEVEGNLITLAKSGAFDVISHGCNCMCCMKSGIAPQMVAAFGCNLFPLEIDMSKKGDINKLGQIDAEKIYLLNGDAIPFPSTQYTKEQLSRLPFLYVVNSYTQYIPSRELKPLDYEALTLCMRKIGHRFKGQRIGLPYVIGCGLAGGDKNIVIPILQRELKDMDVSLVRLPE